jgi:hypothetical protein
MQWRTILKGFFIIGVVVVSPDLFTYVRTRTGPHATLGTFKEGNEKIKAFAKTHPQGAEVKAYLEKAGFSCKTRAFAEFGKWERMNVLKDYKTEATQEVCRYRISILGDACVVFFYQDKTDKIVYLYTGYGDVFT